MNTVVAFLLLMIMGCSSTEVKLDVTLHTHKVFISTDWLMFQDEYGFSCGRVERSSDGWVYVASLNDWGGKVRVVPHSDFNRFEDAVSFVERWCKP